MGIAIWWPEYWLAVPGVLVGGIALAGVLWKRCIDFDLQGQRVRSGWLGPFVNRIDEHSLDKFSLVLARCTMDVTKEKRPLIPSAKFRGWFVGLHGTQRGTFRPEILTLGLFRQEHEAVEYAAEIASGTGIGIVERETVVEITVTPWGWEGR